MAEPVPGISAVPDEQNARYFHVVVSGPEGSPFEGGVFRLELFLPEEYPMSTPNPDDPLNDEVADQWKMDEVEAIKTAKEWTKKHATG